MGSPLPFDLSSLGTTLPVRKTPESFLGPNAALVNLDSLVTKPAQPAPIANPFLAASGMCTPYYNDVSFRFLGNVSKKRCLP